MSEIIDIKDLLYKMLRDQFNALNAQFPDKIRTKVQTVYPRTLLDIDQDFEDPQSLPKALITITRSSIPAEQRVITNLYRWDPNMIRMAQMAQLPKNKGRILNDVFNLAVWSMSAHYRDRIVEVLREVLFDIETEFMQRGHAYKFFQISGGEQEVDAGQNPARTIYRGYIGMTVAYIRTKALNVSDFVSSLDLTADIHTPSGGFDPYGTPYVTAFLASSGGVNPPDVFVY